MANILKSFRNLWSRKPRSCVRRPAATVRLGLECLEGRITPANNIAISAALDLNINVSPVVNGVVTISTTNINAQLSLVTLDAQLSAAGVRKVVVSSAVAAGGIDGGEAGNITWSSVAGSLDINGIGLGQSLVFQADATATVGDILFTNALIADFAPFIDSATTNDDSLLLTLDSSAGIAGTVGFTTTGGGVILGGVANLEAVTFDAGTGGAVSLPDGAVNASIIFANTVLLNGNTITIAASIAAGETIAATAGTQVSSTDTISAMRGSPSRPPSSTWKAPLKVGAIWR